MNKSTVSKASNASSKMLEQLANRSQSRIYKAEGTFNDQEMRIIWNALGLYINRNLRMGRGVNVPRLGIFSFTPPQVRLKGVTNQNERDHHPRTPVFLIQKQFLKGVSLKSAIFYHQQFGMGLRPYTALGSTGDIPITKMNLIQVASYANMSKDATQIALNRIIKYLGEKLLSGVNISIQIPNVGNLLSRGNLVAVKFNQFLNRDTRTILSKSLDERKQKGVMNLTTDNLQKLNKFTDMSQKLSNRSNQFFQIDDGAKKYLNQTFGLNFDSNQMKRTTSGLDRSFASRQFDKTNVSLKNSHFMRMSGTGFLTNKIKFFNREYNFALKIVREWVHNNCESTQKSFKQFCNLVSPTKQVLKEQDIWTACKCISSDITQQQSQQLFRLLDFNKDGFVTQDDWNKNINFDTNKLFKNFVASIQKKNWKVSKILKQMNLQGVKSVQMYKIKQGILRISPQTSDDNALHLSRYMCKGQNQITIEQFLDILNITNLSNQKETPIIVDKQWENKFIARIKRKMVQNNVFEEELLNKFKFYDGKNSGFVDQTDFKTVLSQIGIGITLSELIKIVKVLPINSSNQIDYNDLVNRISQEEVTTETNKILTESEFLSVLNEKFFNKNPLPVKIPISVQKLVSYLQSTLFKDYNQGSLIKYVKKIDVNEDSQISEQDLKAFLERLNQQSFYKLQTKLIQILFAKLKQKTIKKKISLHDVFKMIDTANNGFISKQQWVKNINKIFDFNQQEKQNLFDFMDKKKLSVIDYQSFLSAMNGSNNHVKSQNFDWTESILQNAKKWYETSKLTLEDSYKIVDKDGDSYINEKDLINFITTHLKVHERQISSVRIQKLIKVLDTYKKGKLNFIDWKHFVEKKTSNWIQQAKHQIGIILSRMYPNLQEAYTDITQGDRKLLFTSFQKWIKANKILSGFMINDDILKSLYSNIDSHKKGYLLQNDFISTFSSYHWKVQHEKQFFDQLKSKFKSCQQAFKCLVSYEKNVQLNLIRFLNGVNQIFGKRFTKSDIQNIWKKISSGRDYITLSQFETKYGVQWKSQANPIDKQYPKDGWLYRDFNIIKGTTVRKQQFAYSQNEKMEEQSQKIVDNIKDMLLTSPKTLEQAFAEVDNGKSGTITNLQFKKAFRVLNIALTSKQIDLLLNYCDFKVQSLINWKQFIKRINLREQKIIIFKRLMPKIQHLSDLFHYYMVSPKDAFRKWNNPRSGYMNFEQFYKMLKNLYEQGSETLPQFQMLKQLFQYIDIRKDQVIDFQEFTQTFRNCRPPSLLMGTTPATQNQTKTKFVIQKHQQNGPIRQQYIPLFKNSPNYQKFVNLIGRNRKYLQTEIQKKSISKFQPLVPFSVVQEVFMQLLKNQKLKIQQNLIRNVIAFSMTGEKVDYKLLFSNFKERNESILQFPKQNIF